MYIKKAAAFLGATALCIEYEKGTTLGFFLM